MSKRAIHILLAFGLTLGLFAGSLATVRAQDSEPNTMYFPWVPNGSMIDDDRDFGETGPYYGSITVQNLEDEDVDVYYETLATGEVESEDLDSNASVTLNVDDLFEDDEADGSGVIVWGVFDDQGMDGDSARIAAVQKQAAPDDFDEDAETDDEHETVAGYTGLTDDEIGQSVVLPIVQTNSNWNTLIRVTNFEESEEISVTLDLHPAGGGSSPSFTIDDIAAGETATVDLLDLNLDPGWVGSATLTSTDEGTTIGAVAERVKNETNMLIMNTSRPLPQDGAEQYAPLVFNNYNFWNTGIAIANLSDQENDVTITYYDPDGNQMGEVDELELPPNGMDFVYTPASGDDEGFLGSAIIEADGPIAGAVDEVKYFGDDPNTGHAMSYMVETQTAMSNDTSRSLAMPLVQKGVVGGLDIVHGDTSGIHLFNPSDEFVVVAISYFDEAGIEEHTELVLLEGQSGHTSYTIDLDQEIEDDFQGNALIEIAAGSGEVVAASNNVNYDVEFDGSASFNLVRTGDVDLPYDEDEVQDLVNGDGS